MRALQEAAAQASRALEDGAELGTLAAQGRALAQAREAQTEARAAALSAAVGGADGGGPGALSDTELMGRHVGLVRESRAPFDPPPAGARVQRRAAPSRAAGGTRVTTPQTFPLRTACPPRAPPRTLS